MLRETSRPCSLWRGAVTAIGIAGCSPSGHSQQTIVLTPGQDLEVMVAHAPEGTRFRFEPGIYRQQTIRPKNRQEFIGQEGVILSGAMVLDRLDQRIRSLEARWASGVRCTFMANARTAGSSANSGRTSSSTVDCTSASKLLGRSVPRANGSTRTAAPI